MRVFVRPILMGWFSAVGLGCSLEAALGVESPEGSTDAASTGLASDEGSFDGTTLGVVGSAEDDSTGTTGGLGPPGTCGGRSLRVATYNIKSVNSPSSMSFEALVAIVQRIDADVLCFQEVEEFEFQSLQVLADATGYPRLIQANDSPAIGGALTNACLSRFRLSLEGSYSSRDLSSDQEANDVGRDILLVQAELADADQPSCRVGIVTLHLKSGQAPVDWFRRQVEVQRVVQAVQRYREDYPDDAMVIVGDLNESLDDPALGHIFLGIPEGLPPSYRVGNDIAFPLVYQPFDTLRSPGFSIVDATQEDTVSAYATWDDAVRLDYVLYSGGMNPVADEVYNACRDNGFDDAPVGYWMAKAGDPLPCATSATASDHFPVVVDLVLP